MANYWQATSYGYAPIYFVTIGGIPVVFSEKRIGHGLPTGWTSEDPSLVIDDSAEIGVEAIDRDRAIGTGFDLSFKLLDSPTVRSWLRRWQVSATLTADLLAGDATATVDDCAGWGSAGTFYAGNEAIKFHTRPDDQTLGGLWRGQIGTYANDHKVGTTGQVVTDLPRHLRGRDVTLWAVFADASGHVCGDTLTGQEAVQLWRGRITSPPERKVDGFAFAAQSIDRLLDESLAGKMSGDVAGVAPLTKVDPGWTFAVYFKGVDSANADVWNGSVTCNPFAGMTSTYMTNEEFRTRVSTKWAAGVTASGLSSHVGDLYWAQQNGTYHAQIKLLKDATVYQVFNWLYLDGPEFDGTPQPYYPGGMTGDDLLDLNLDPGVPLFSPVDDNGAQVPTGVAIKLTEGIIDDVPDTGKIKLTSGSLTCTYAYSAKGTVGDSEDDNGNLHLHGLQALQGQVGFTTDQFSGATAEVLLGDTGTFDDLALRCLESSGTGLRGTYDTLARGAGYGLDSSLINESSFSDLLATDPVGSLQGDVTLAGGSFTEVFGGILALFRMAVVARPDLSDNTIKLTCVPTAQGTNYTATITDSDLLSHAGDPVVSVKRSPTPNVVTVTRQPAGIADTDKLIFTDFGSIDAVGKVEVGYRVDATDRAALANAALPAVSAHFAYDETVQAVELLTHPSVTCEVGDAIWLTCTHPALWTFGTTPAHTGYDGPGRVTGKKLNLKTGQVTLTVLIDGSLKLFALSPAALIIAYDDDTAPSWIDVDSKYLEHFSASLAGGSVELLHYQPGRAESAGDVLTLTAAAMNGNCRLSVTSAGGFTLDTSKESTLTLPLTAPASTYQKLFAHTADGSNFG